MRKASPLRILFAILTSGALCGTAQNAGTAMQNQPPKPRSPGAYTLHVDTDEVVLNCTVLDHKGELVNDLTRKNFKVFEDKTLQAVISLQHQDTPVSIGLLVDNSGSMKEKRAAITNAALDLVKASNPQDQTFVINFSDRAYLDQDFTSDLGNLQNGLSHLTLSGGTALYDTVVTAADKMERSATRPRKVLIVITDGDDNSSKLALDDAIHRVQDLQGPIVYSIGLLFGSNNSRHAKHDLEAISHETGGIAFFPGSLKDVDSVAAEVARDIRNQYAIAYHSPQAAVGGYHTVRVEAQAPEHSKLTVYTRSGYSSNHNTGGQAK
jgi:Ca-activated chloride channel family protein